MRHEWPIPGCRTGQRECIQAGRSCVEPVPYANVGLCCLIFVTRGRKIGPQVEVVVLSHVKFLLSLRTRNLLLLRNAIVYRLGIGKTYDLERGFWHSKNLTQTLSVYTRDIPVVRVLVLFDVRLKLPESFDCGVFHGLILSLGAYRSTWIVF